jgi:hypothetical protein
MFDCQKTREFVDLYLDNELESVPTKHVAEHLEKCAECRREFELIRSQNELLASSIKSEQYDTTKLSAEIEAATVGKAAIRLPELSLPRMPVWVFALGCIFILAVSAVLYLPGKIGRAFAHPLYDAAAADHRACFADSAAPDWIRSQQGISELATSFLNQKTNVPFSVVGEYKIARARICKFKDGLPFLHVVYETTDGRYLSLFIGHPAGVLSGEHSEMVNGHDLHLAHVSGLAVFCVSDRDRLLFATAPEDNVARNAMLSFLGN